MGDAGREEVTRRERRAWRRHRDRLRHEADVGAAPTRVLWADDEVLDKPFGMDEFRAAIFDLAPPQ